ncbi:DUF4846 domain-containing protein [Paenibacillus chitinolyticus]|uniref:DUF4846 domain-containing protein n=1 Tax=Paenibacillus chitinolyticus TaxID=79263 RepID=UPI001C485263|nr:DUF4846 domain-containing protein [Paenibacillus chitinolyticus]MBV6715671.1 DUF4846 domain-containing protein [Paenibacillus chitinolyticus]
MSFLYSDKWRQSALLGLLVLSLGVSACESAGSSGPSAKQAGKVAGSEKSAAGQKAAKNAAIVTPEGVTLQERFKAPKGFERTAAEPGSFAAFLRGLKLKPDGSVVHLFDGREKNKPGVYEAVVDIPIGSRDLHQCADAVMLLRAQYLFDRKQYGKIHFNFVNGFKAEYSKWMNGYRIKMNGNQASWVKNAGADNSQEGFRKFMDVVFAYAGTLSLEKELVPVQKSEVKPGDVFIIGGSPGHAVIVVDTAVNKSTGETLFMLAQSYTPAQETQILANPANSAQSPWYTLKEGGGLKTPEWEFGENSLRRFQEN